MKRTGYGAARLFLAALAMALAALWAPTELPAQEAQEERIVIKRDGGTITIEEAQEERREFIRDGFIITFDDVKIIIPSVKDDQLTFSIPDLDGDVVSLSDDRFEGKVVLVDIWGTWCGPCRFQIHHLVRFYEKYRDQGLEIVGIAFENGPLEKQLQEIKRFSESHAVEYTMLHGGSTGDDVEKQLPTLENFHGYPTTIFIGRDGKVRKLDVGWGESKAPAMEEYIVQLLAE